MTAIEYFEDGNSWTDQRARFAFPILLMLAKSAHNTTYKGLDIEIAKQNDEKAIPIYTIYGKVLEKVGRTLNFLSQEWREEIPPLTILVVNSTSKKPSPGVDGFLQRFVAVNTNDQLTSHNRTAMIERATNAVHNYSRWDEVAAYLQISISGQLPETTPIPLSLPKPVYGGESQAHKDLKNQVACHPEWFKQFGAFEKGTTEFRLYSGDEVDVLFQGADRILAVEVKTETVTSDEITRGIFQCIKYRAVLRAMADVKAELVNIQTVLVTPKSLSADQQHAAHRLNVAWQKPG